MMPIVAVALDLALFDFPVFFAAMFLCPRFEMKVTPAQMPGFPADPSHAAFLQPSRPLLLSISLTAENGSFFRSATSAASEIKLDTRPTAPQTRSNTRASSRTCKALHQY